MINTIYSITDYQKRDNPSVVFKALCPQTGNRRGNPGFGLLALVCHGQLRVGRGLRSPFWTHLRGFCNGRTDYQGQRLGIQEGHRRKRERPLRGHTKGKALMKIILIIFLEIMSLYRNKKKETSATTMTLCLLGSLDFDIFAN